MTDDIFGKTTTEGNTPTETQVDGLDEFVGEGKKYASVVEALKAIPHAQKHIKTIEGENSSLQEELKQLNEQVGKFETIEETLRRIEATSNTARGTADSHAPISKDEIKHLVREASKEVKSEEQMQGNIVSVHEAMVAKHGEEAIAKLQERATELGMTVESLKTLSATAPRAAINLLLGTSQKTVSETTTSGGTGTVNTESLSQLPNTGTDANTYSYYRNIQKTDPKRFFSAAIQREILDKATRIEGFMTS